MTTRIYAYVSLALLAHGQGAPDDRIERAKKAAGTQWAEAADFFCAPSAMPNRPTDPAIQPTRLFDNLSVIGSVGTAIYIVHTGDGLVLIDAGYPEQVETVLLPGLKALALDPGQVRAIIVTHGHSDHFGAAKYFQDTYKTRVYLSAADWDLLTTPESPKRDQIVIDRQPITFGGTEFLPVLVPGHTKGSLALIFSVSDKGQKHTAGLFGGTVLSAGFVTADGLGDYVKSIGNYARVAAENHVDVEIQNHPLMDGFAARLEQLKKAGTQDAHPFVIGEAAYASFLAVMSECAQAQLIRKQK